MVTSSRVIGMLTVGTTSTMHHTASTKLYWSTKIPKISKHSVVCPESTLPLWYIVLEYWTTQKIVHSTPSINQPTWYDRKVQSS